MKKLYTKEQYKERTKKKQNQVLKKIIKKEKIKKNATSDFISKKFYNNVKNRVIEVVNFPEIFSLIEKPIDLIDFYADIRSKIYNGNPLYLNKNKIKKITLDSLIYIIAFFQYLKLRNINYLVLGNSPKEIECKEVFENSGFLKFVNTRNNNFKFNDNDKYFQIKSSNIVDNQIAKEIVVFIQKHLGKNQADTRGIYRMLIELMNNTHEHAYTKKNITSNWYLIAKYDSINKKIDFAFLDTGVGIPSTINKNLIERASIIVSELGGIINKDIKYLDSDLIESALKGEFRTQTIQSFRGKGLPCINEFSTNNYIQDLIIISNYGYINCSKNEKIELEKKFYGTLYSWCFK